MKDLTNGFLNGNLHQKKAIATGWDMIIGYAAKKRANCSSYQYPGYFSTLRKGNKQRNDAQVHASSGPLKTETLLKIDSNFVSPKQLTMRLCNSNFTNKWPKSKSGIQNGYDLAMKQKLDIQIQIKLGR